MLPIQYIYYTQLYYTKCYHIRNVTKSPFYPLTDSVRIIQNCYLLKSPFIKEPFIPLKNKSIKSISTFYVLRNIPSTSIRLSTLLRIKNIPSTSIRLSTLLRIKKYSINQYQTRYTSVCTADICIIILPLI